MVSLVSAALPKHSDDAIGNFGGPDVLRHLHRFLDKATKIYSSFKTGLVGKDKAKQLEDHFVGQPVVTLKDIRTWERLKGKTLADFDPEDPHIAFTKKIQHLDLTPVIGDEEGLSEELALIYLHRFSNLRSLDLSGTKVGNQTVSFLAHNFPDLERLSLNACDQITSASGLQTLVRLHQKLVAVALSGIAAVGDTVVMLLVRNNPGLQQLELEDTSITDSSALSLAHVKNTLTYLNLSANPGLTNIGVGNVLRHLSKLKVLLMRDLNEEHTPESMLLNIERSSCQELEEIAIHHDFLTDEVVREMAMKFPHLKHFRIDNDKVSEEAFYLVLQNCQDLRTLNLRHFEINDQMIGLITQLPHLTSIDLIYNDITIEQLNAILAQAPSLERVIVSDTFPQELLTTHFPHIEFEFRDDTPLPPLPQALVAEEG